MEIDRIRREIREELASAPNVPEGRDAKLEAALAELAERSLPSDDVIELLLTDAPEVSLTEAMRQRQAQRVKDLMGELRAQVAPVGEVLARARQRADMPVDRAATTIGVATDVLRQIEQGVAPARLLHLSAQQVRTLTDLLRIPPDAFAWSLARSAPPPAAYAFGYRPRQDATQPAERMVTGDESEQLASWLESYLSE